MSSKETTRKSITVETLFLECRKKLKLNLVSCKGSFQRQIFDKGIHRPSLALAGFTHKFASHQIQLCGVTEAAYLDYLEPDARIAAVERVFSFDIPCVIFTHTDEVSPEFIALAKKAGVSVFQTPFETTRVIQILGDYLDEKFALQTLIHGTLVDVYGVGCLITGRSGIGKSEVALDLIARGHRLVVDDAVTVIRRTGGVLIGLSNDTLDFHMEIRGLGIVDIQSIYGIRGIRRNKRIEVQLELVEWDCSEKYERLGLEEATKEVLGVQLPHIRLPIYPGKNISVIAEVIALDHLLKQHGHHSAKKFETRLSRKMQEKMRTLKGYPLRGYE